MDGLVNGEELLVSLTASVGPDVASVVNAYRQVLDGSPVADFAPELEAVSHRPYGTGFFFGEAEQAPNYDGYEQQAMHVADVVTADLESRTIVARCRNRFEEGEELEVLSPRVPISRVVVRNLTWLPDPTESDPDPAPVPVPVANRSCGIYRFAFGAGEGAVAAAATGTETDAGAGTALEAGTSAAVDAAATRTDDGAAAARADAGASAGADAGASDAVAAGADAVPAARAGAGITGLSLPAAGDFLRVRRFRRSARSGA